MKGQEQENAIPLKWREWLDYAECDLVAARKLAFGEELLLDYAAYHCEQAAEKAIKGLLSYNGYDGKRLQDIGHKIATLIHEALQFDPNIDSRLGERKILSDYASDPRYPEPGSAHVTRKMFKLLLVDAEGFYYYILSTLPQEVINERQALAQEQERTKRRDSV